MSSKRALGGKPLGQRLTGDQRHDQKRQSAAGLHLMNGQHVRMHDGRGGLRLAGESASGERTVRQMRRQHLDRHATLKFAIESFKHDAHAAMPDDLQHIVATQSTEHVRLIGRLQMLDGEIDLRQFVAA